MASDMTAAADLEVRRLVPADAAPYRTLMLEAYELHPDAFTSTVSERASLPLSWWESRVKPEASADELVLGAFRGSRLSGVVGLSFESREKARHKAHMFGMYVPSKLRNGGVGKKLVLGVLEFARKLGEAFPDHAEVFAKLANLYTRMAYSELPLPKTALATLEEVWEQMVHGAPVGA